MARSLPDLTQEERSAIARTLARWAEMHPRPDIPIAQLLDGSELTPRSMADAVQDPNSTRGQFIFRVFAAGLIEDASGESETLDQILADFVLDAQGDRS